MDKLEKLGERINRYRTERGLSQLELSELLEVSRQSISKWETDVAVPELSKLVRMAEIFGISLDELVLGKESDKAEEKPIEAPAPVDAKKPYSPIKAGMGFMFLGVGILLSILLLLLSGELLAALVLFLPFALSAFFCLKQFRRAGLWCTESWFVCLVGYFRFATGIDWNPMIYPIGEGLNLRTIMSFVFFFCLVGFICLTVFSYRKEEILLSRKKHIALACVTAFALPVKWLAGLLMHLICLYGFANGDPEYFNRVIFVNYGVPISILNFLVDFAFIFAFTASLVPTFYWLRGMMRKRKEDK